MTDARKCLSYTCVSAAVRNDCSFVLASLEFLIMNCAELAKRIEKLQPGADTRDVARLCLLLSNGSSSVDTLSDDSRLKRAWKEIGLRLQAATDQHAAMTDELERLAMSDPKKFSPDQIWILIRAIKVQSQILQMYIGETGVDL